MSDVFDDIFRMIRLESCVYFQREFRAPWAMRIGPTPMAQFHLVLGGPCVIETGTACQPPTGEPESLRKMLRAPDPGQM